MNLNSILNRVALPVSILVVVAVLVGIVYSIYDLMSPIEVSPTTSIESGNQPTIRVDDIVRVNLFGSPEKPEDSNYEVVKETTLNLTLVSVVFDESHPDQSWARIAQGTQKAKKYSNGDRIGGVANLSEVLRDRVILERLGQRELLAFDDEYDYFETKERSLSFDTTQRATEISGSSGYIHQQMLEDNQQEASNSSESTQEGNGSSEPQLQGTRELIESFKQRLEEDPKQFLEEVGLTPVSPDKGSGYKVSENLAKQLGLREGDVLTSVNGETLGDIESDMPRVLEQLNGSTANLEVRRGDELISIEIQLDQ
ncbi:MAG: PDZ domain-containing protein [Gammaproteobacteria bacterium]|nr:PDZ domain-containing protein [Gammaproteobacteria bacterium]